MISTFTKNDSSLNLHQPSIAIIVAVYNGADTLSACIESLLGQHVPPDQIIIQDGGSTDETLTILEGFRLSVSHVESARDAGIYDAWNKALRHLDSEWVWFLGCDDRLADKNVIARLKAYLSSASHEVGLVYGIVHNVSPNGAVSERVGRPWNQARKAITYRMSVPHTALLARSHLFSSVGNFDIRYRIAGDFEWFSRAIKRTHVEFLDQLLVLAGDGGISQHIKTRLNTVIEYGEIIRRQGKRRPFRWHWIYLTTSVNVVLQGVFGHRARIFIVNAYRVLTFRPPRSSAE